MITRATLRAFSTEALKVFDDVAKRQYTATWSGSSGEAAVIEYEKRGKHITLYNTYVPTQFQGKGVGKLLAKYAFDDALQNKLSITCKCHFLVNYYEKNKDKYKSIPFKVELDEAEQNKK